MSEQIQRYDMDGNKISLRNLCIQEPDWAVNRILHLELSHPTNDAKIYKDAIKVWGEQSQIEMIKEECLELALALQKMNRVGGRELDVERYEKVIDEIADVEIMIEQARILFSGELIDKRKEYKLKRLAERLSTRKSNEQEG